MRRVNRAIELLSQGQPVYSSVVGEPGYEPAASGRGPGPTA